MNWVDRFDNLSAVGGWGVADEMVMSFLLGEGLEPSHTFLDVGCGKLRVGRHLVDYLNSGNYTGMDVSPDALKKGREVLAEEDLQHEDVTLIENDDLKLRELEGETFDFILSFEVFTHLKKSQVRECLEHVSNVMHGGSAFYFTFNQSGFERKFSSKTFIYDKDEIRSLAESNGFKVTEIKSNSYIPNAEAKPMFKLKL